MEQENKRGAENEYIANLRVNLIQEEMEENARQKEREEAEKN